MTDAFVKGWNKGAPAIAEFVGVMFAPALLFAAILFVIWLFLRRLP